MSQCLLCRGSAVDSGLCRQHLDRRRGARRRSEGGLRTPDVAILTGATSRQLDYWARQGLVEPVNEAMGSGSHRLWSEDDVPMLRAMAAVSRLTSGTNAGPNLPVRVIAKERGLGPWSCEFAGVRITVALVEL